MVFIRLSGIETRTPLTLTLERVPASQYCHVTRELVNKEEIMKEGRRMLCAWHADEVFNKSNIVKKHVPEY